MSDVRMAFINNRIRVLKRDIANKQSDLDRLIEIKEYLINSEKETPKPTK